MKPLVNRPLPIALTGPGAVMTLGPAQRHAGYAAAGGAPAALRRPASRPVSVAMRKWFWHKVRDGVACHEYGLCPSLRDQAGSGWRAIIMSCVEFSCVAGKNWPARTFAA